MANQEDTSTIKVNDKVNSALMLGQAPIIAILICLIFDEFNSVVLFMITVSAIWLGTQNAVREIVSEIPFYKRRGCLIFISSLTYTQKSLYYHYFLYYSL